MKRYLENPDHYNNMVRLLVEYNPMYERRAKQTLSTAEEKAADIIDYCIRGALDKGDTSTGCCHATKTPAGKVRLFLEPLF